MPTAVEKNNLKLNIGSNKNTALVSGGSGFLGSHLCEALVSQGFAVISVDKPNVNSKANLKELLTSPNFTTWEEDINKADFKLSPTISPTHIFHLASVEEQLSSSQISLQTLLLNSLGTKNLLDLAVQRKAKFILVSSTEVFHGALSQTSLETYFGKGADPAELSFAEAKRFAENLTAEYFKNYGVSTTIVRIKDPYGPRMGLEEGEPLSTLINQAVRKNKVELNNDGLRTHNPTYVTDIIYGIIKAALGQHKGEIFNLINTDKLTERSIAETIKQFIGELEIVYKKGEEVELPSYPLIIDPTKEKLGWSPKVSFEDGLRETIAFIKSKENKNEPPKANHVPRPSTLLEERQYRKTGGSLLRRILFVSLMLLLAWVILIPPLLFGVNIYMGQENLEKARRAVTEDSLTSAGKQAKNAEEDFERAENTTRNFFWPSHVPWFSEKVEQTRNYLFFAENISGATKFTARGLAVIKELGTGEIDTKTSKRSVDSAEKEIVRAERKLEIARSVEIEQDKLPGPLKNSYKDLLRYQEQLTDLVDTVRPAF